MNSNNKPLIENYSVKISHCNKMWPYLGLISVFYNDNSDVYCHIVVGIFPIFVYLFTQTSFNYHFFKNAFGFCIAVFIEMVLRFFGMTNHCSNLWRLLNALIYFVDCWPNETEQNQNKFDEISQIEFSKIEIENKKKKYSSS